MIRAEGLTKRFGDLVAVDRVSLEVAEGEIYGLVGPDGAGKTTLLRILCGLLEPDAGTLAVMGCSGRDMERVKEALGYMPQRFGLYGDLSVDENMRFFGMLYGLGGAELRRRSDEILELTRLGEFRRRLADQLSGGMKQKLALGCALLTRPRLLVLDEPTYGVDPEFRKEFWRILYGLNLQGRTIVVSTPYMDEAELCTRVSFISGGRLVATDTPPGLRAAFGKHLLEVRLAGRPGDFFRGIPGVEKALLYGDAYHMVVEDAAAAGQALRERARERAVEVLSMREIDPSMEDVFVALAEDGGG